MPSDTLRAVVSGPYLSSSGIVWMWLGLANQSEGKIHIQGITLPKPEDFGVLADAWEKAELEFKELPLWYQREEQL